MESTLPGQERHSNPFPGCRSVGFWQPRVAAGWKGPQFKFEQYLLELLLLRDTNQSFFRFRVS